MFAAFGWSLTGMIGMREIGVEGSERACVTNVDDSSQRVYRWVSSHQLKSTARPTIWMDDRVSGTVTGLKSLECSLDLPWARPRGLSQSKHLVRPKVGYKHFPVIL